MGVFTAKRRMGRLRTATLSHLALIPHLPANPAGARLLLPVPGSWFERRQRMPLKNVVWIKLWLCLLDNDDFMDNLTDAEKWYFIGMLLLYPKHGYRLKDDKKFFSKKLTQTGQDIAQSVDNIVKVMGLKRRNACIYIPNFKKYNPYIWKGKGIPAGTIKEFPDKIREDEEEDKIKIKKEIHKERKFAYHSFKEANNPVFKDYLKKAYPGVNVDFEFIRMESWLLTNPKKRYKNYAKFCRGWIDRDSTDAEYREAGILEPERTYESPVVGLSEEEVKKHQEELAEMVKKIAEGKKL